MPVLLLMSTFLAGALMRQKMEDTAGGMGLFVLGVMALIAYSILTYQDIVSFGGIYSCYMPKLLRFNLLDYLWFLPGVGLLGMMCYKQFTLKLYS